MRAALDACVENGTRVLLLPRLPGSILLFIRDRHVAELRCTLDRRSRHAIPRLRRCAPVEASGNIGGSEDGNVGDSPPMPMNLVGCTRRLGSRPHSVPRSTRRQIRASPTNAQAKNVGGGGALWVVEALLWVVEALLGVVEALLGHQSA